MFGTNITVDLDSTWKENVDQRNLEIQRDINISEEQSQEENNTKEEEQENESKTD